MTVDPLPPEGYEHVKRNLFARSDDADTDERLVEIAVARGLLTEAQVEECLRERERRADAGQRVRLEDLLVERRLLTEDVRRELLSPATESQDKPAGRLGKYLLLREIAKGGMGAVFEAEDPGLGRRVALKVVRDEGDDEEYTTRLHREAAIAARLHHPNIVGIHDVGVGRDEDGRPVHFIAMDLIEGKTLADILEERKTDLPDLLRMFHDVVRAVSFAHANGVIHRDLKPGNVLVETGGRVVLTDFGIARSEQFVTQLTRSHSILGTPHYMAPEQVEGRTREISERTDVYALGAVLYEILVGRPPHQAENIGRLYAKILHEPPTPPRRLRKDVPWELEAIALKALEKEPHRRYSAVAELGGDIHRYVNHRPVSATRITWLHLWRLWMRRHRALLATTGAGVVAGTAIAAWALWIQPYLRAKERHVHLLNLERRAEQMAVAETRRLEGLDPDAILREAPADRVAARIRARIPANDAAEEAAVRRGSATYRPGPLFSRAYYQKGKWSLAYRWDPSGKWGVPAQLEIARGFMKRRKYREAVPILRRIWARHAVREALPHLGEALMETGNLKEAAAAFSTGRVDSPLTRFLDAIFEERQSLVIPPGGPGGGIIQRREPICLLRLSHPTLLLPFRAGRPAFEVRAGKLVPVSSPLAVLPPSDRIIDARTADLNSDRRPEIVVAVERLGEGGGVSILEQSEGRWKVAREFLTSPVQPIAVEVGDLDGDGRTEILVLFKWGASEHSIVRWPEGRVIPFHPGGGRPWAFTPLIGDLDGDGRGELMLGRSIQIGGEVQFFRSGKPLASAVVGEPRSAIALPGGRIAMTAEIDPDYLRGKVRDALGKDARDALVTFRWRGDGIVDLKRYPVPLYDTARIRLGNLTAGRLSGEKAILFLTYPVERKRSPARLQALYGDAALKVISPALPVEPKAVLLSDLDGDGESELLLVTEDRLLVRGRRESPLPSLPFEERDKTLLSGEAAVLLGAAENLARFESYEPARDVLRRLLARYPQSPEAGEARLLTVDLHLRQAEAEISESESKMRARDFDAADRLYAQALKRCGRTVQEARLAARRPETTPFLRRYLHRQAARACRLLRDWKGYHRSLLDADAGTAGEDRIRLARMRDHPIYQGTLARKDAALFADFPARASVSSEGVWITIDSHSRQHVLGLPIKYHGGAVEFQLDFDLEGSAWSAPFYLGLVPRSPDPTPGRVPGHLKFFLHGTTAWDRQGILVGAKFPARLHRYRGKWRLRYGFYPEANLVWTEIDDLDRNRTVYRTVRDSGVGLPYGAYVLGILLMYEGGDALLFHRWHPPRTRVRLGRISLWAVGAGIQIQDAAPTSVRKLELTAGGFLLRGKKREAIDLYRRALRRDPTAHSARVHLAMLGGTPDEFYAGFDIDLYGFLLVLDDALRGVEGEYPRRIGSLLRGAPERYRSIARVLLGEPVRELPGTDAAARYLRLRRLVGAAASYRQDWEWLAARSLRTPGAEIPGVYWAPGPGETLDSLRRAMREATDPMRRWAIASRVLLLSPNDREAIRIRVEIALKLGREGRAEMDLLRQARNSPRDPDAWFLLAQLFARRKAGRETLEFLSHAVRCGLPARRLRLPDFAFLSKDPRFLALVRRGSH